ncbi:MAG TPA: CinA family protein, partial [Rhodospirillaceae bacterium]|nr:CinA family protein [Rhodospirillaceae bacterium]
MAGNVLRFKAKAAMQSCCNLGIKLAVAESCTGGLLSEALTALPGSSAFFDSGYITYSNSAKIEMLGVPANLLARFGAVSPEVACAMAEGALSHAKADASLGITGIAGPTGGSTEK